MKKPMIITFAALFGLALMQPVSAGQYAPRIDRMADEQKQEIRKGVKRGDLTREEAKRLKAQQHRIANLKREFAEDGRLSKRERRILRDRYERADHRIDRLMHNDERRYPRYSRHHRHDRHGHDYGYWDLGPRVGIWFQDDDWYFERKWR